MYSTADKISEELRVDLHAKPNPRSQICLPNVAMAARSDYLGLLLEVGDSSTRRVTTCYRETLTVTF